MAAAYITPGGMQSLRTELDHLVREKRPEVTQRVAAAAALGDRSENAEYIYGKRQLREIDRRIRFLSKRIEDLTVVDRTPDDESRVYFGAWVSLEDDEGDQACYRIVGSDEFDAGRNWISMQSPMARALLGKTLDADVTVALPDGEKHYVVVDIHYEDPTQ